MSSSFSFAVLTLITMLALPKLLISCSLFLLAKAFTLIESCSTNGFSPPLAGCAIFRGAPRKTCRSLSKRLSDVSVTPSVCKGSTIEPIPSIFFGILSKPPFFASDLVVTSSDCF